MKNEKLILLVVGAIALVLVIGYFLVKVIYNERAKANSKPHIGTWTTESGDEKLIISNGSLIYIDLSNDIRDTCSYKTEYYDSEDEQFVLIPTEDNEIGILGAFEKIKYRGGILIGGILVHDMGVHTTEFRKKW